MLEIAGLAPVPFAGMILADFGADVVRVDRLTPGLPDVLARGKRSIALDFKSAGGVEVFSRLAQSADVVIEPFRPGVMEKLGLGPDRLCTSNPKLVYARLTGFGQTGPLAPLAGHDVNYLAVSGVLSMFARKGGVPLPPINLLADFAGGGMACSLGIMMALFERTRSGQGQVVDCAMVDAVPYLGSMIFNFKRMGLMSDAVGENLLDTGAPFYDVYTTKDGKHLAVGAIEPQFYKLLVQGMGLKDLPPQNASEHWPKMKALFAERFATRTRDEWMAVFGGTDACVSPVLTREEYLAHEHTLARGNLIPRAGGEGPGDVEIAPAPKLSRTPGAATALPSPDLGQHTMEVLTSWGGYTSGEVAALHHSGSVLVAGELDAPPTAKL